MRDSLFAPVGTKTHINPKTKYIIIHSTSKRVMNNLLALEVGRKDGKRIARPELFEFKTRRRSNMRVLKFNKFVLAIVGRMLKKYPDEVLVFIGENYWFSELPKEIQKYGDWGGSNKQLKNRIEKEEEE